MVTIQVSELQHDGDNLLILNTNLNIELTAEP